MTIAKSRDNPQLRIDLLSYDNIRNFKCISVQISFYCILTYFKIY